MHHIYKIKRSRRLHEQSAASYVFFELKSFAWGLQKDTQALPDEDDRRNRAVRKRSVEGRGAFEKEFLVSEGPTNPKTNEPFGKLTKAYREWAAVQSKCVISGPEFALMTKLQQSVWTHPVAMELLDDGIAEQTVRTSYCSEPCQIRMDWFRLEYEGRTIICDL